MSGYIGSKAVVVSSGAERKKTYAITTTTTSLTGASYTPNQVHVFHNGVRLVDGTDYTATDGTTVTLTSAAENGDEVVVVSYATFSPSDAYTKAETESRYVNITGDTLTGALTGTDLTLSGGIYLGGTGSDNLLDDYEFGFFEPTFTGGTTNPSGITYDNTVGNEGYYVKVGRAVFIQINIRTDAISNVGAGDLRISGLPFAAPDVSGQGGFASFAISQASGWGGNSPSGAYISDGNYYITLFYRSSSSGPSTSSSCSDLGTGTNDNLLRLSGTYYSTA